MLALSRLIAAVIVITSMITVTAALATPSSQQQQQQQQQQSATTSTTMNLTTYTDDSGFTVTLPLGWTPIDWDNTSREAMEVATSQYKETLVEFCPVGQSVVDNTTSTARCNDDFGVIQVSRYLNMDRNPDFAHGASTVDPSTGLIVLDLTAQDLIDFHNRPSSDMIIVQSQDRPVNVSSTENGGTQWQIPGKLVLAANEINQLGWIHLLFVDWTSGYEITYVVPKGQGASAEPISIFGIGLDNLPQELEPILQILTSANLQRPPTA
jgi:type II secretory pathway pseudopilin PulG